MKRQMGMHSHVWNEDAAKRLLQKGREQSEDASFLDRTIGPKKQVIADLGCGPGFYASKLKKFASVLYCIDSSKAMISVARKRIHGKTVKFLEEDSSRTSLPDASIDIVFMANSFHDMEREKTAAEIKRILKPEGKVIVVDWKKGARLGSEEHRGPPESLRMSESEYLEWFPGFKIKDRFEAGADHFGMVLAR